MTDRYHPPWIFLVLWTVGGLLVGGVPARAQTGVMKTPKCLSSVLLRLWSGRVALAE